MRVCAGTPLSHCGQWSLRLMVNNDAVWKVLAARLIGGDSENRMQMAGHRPGVLPG